MTKRGHICAAASWKLSCTIYQVLFGECCHATLLWRWSCYPVPRPLSSKLGFMIPRDLVGMGLPVLKALPLLVRKDEIEQKIGMYLRFFESQMTARAFCYSEYL